MLSERRLRRALYVGTVAGWALAVGLAVLDVDLGPALPFARAALILSVAAAATLSNVTLFAVVVAPLERVYQHGYEAGQHAIRHQQDPADLRRVIGQHSARVVPFRSMNRSGFDG